MHDDTDTDTDGPPRTLLIAAVVVAVAAVVVLLVIAVARQRPVPTQPVPLVGIPAPQASSPDCAAVLDALPAELGDSTRAPLAEPAPPAAAAWRSGEQDEAIVLRCGVDRPAEFVVGAPVQAVDDVQWFRVGEAGIADPGAGRSTWYAVDRGVYLALTLPQGSGPTPIQQISDVIAKTLPAKPVEPAPVG
ncbi:Protein of unknown function [Mycolicibacterium rutilum]|uniref:DUF3515 domain-containing protein n=1 Tax=Mycolicibacterium rutilum TaxID=370526 RepID=A0A1H6LDJ0_MYCRU|nr:DUF3515 domain-containing protein [Mycolicibacterium rutilum]SEH86701.1 Protein of unknown function [Mycolicibacterium rutilum]